MLWIGGRDVIRGEITLGEFVAFNGYLVMLSWPMIAFGWVTNILQRGFASWKRMLEILEQQPAISDANVTPGGRTAELHGAIEVRNLVFAYPGTDRAVLDHVSLRIEPGQTVAFVGGTGSGKSTLINLLPRLHEPPAGTVFIGGVDIREIPLARLRGAIGFVPQEPFLFSATIAENVAFSGHRDVQNKPRVNPDRTPEKSDQTRKRRILISVRALPPLRRSRGWTRTCRTFRAGTKRPSGERGITLSGGQKQRTALARAVMADAEVLILDDALSAVDTYTEEEILGRLRGVMRERTSIIVSHRISTVREADQIFVLDNGRVAERGSHDQLVARGGLYATLYRKQLLEEELQAS